MNKYVDSLFKNADIPCNTVSLLHVFTFMKNIVLKQKDSPLSIPAQAGHERLSRRRAVLHKMTLSLQRNVVFNTMVQLAFFTNPTTKIISVSVKT